MTQPFFDDLPFTAPLFETTKGDAVVHLEQMRDKVVFVRWLAALQRGSGRAALVAVTEAADRHGVTLQLMARPQEPPPYGAGKLLEPAALEAFFAGFGFVVSGRGKFALMTRKPA